MPWCNAKQKWKFGPYFRVLIWGCYNSTPLTGISSRDSKVEVERTWQHLASTIFSIPRWSPLLHNLRWQARHVEAAERTEDNLRWRTRGNLPKTICHWGNKERLDQTKVEPRIGQPITKTSIQTTRWIDRRDLAPWGERQLLDSTILTYQTLP